MCGIAGWVNNGASDKMDVHLLKKMTNTMYHRGPDDAGFFSDNGVFLGHRRLRIIDLEGGHQPMTLSGGMTIVFNGEIYNYKELREILASKGYRFKTESDTEVLLAAYDAWEEKSLENLNGMFSFVVYDPNKQRLFMARDRMGEKPFYYYLSNKLFAFASEIKALLILPEIQSTLEIDPYAVSDYLSLGYILTPKTIYKNILKLPAGHWATYNIREKKFAVEKYWKLEEHYHPDLKLPYDKKAVEQFSELFFSACELRMRSDVPLGGFLSGGIDSSSVVFAMRNISKSPIKVFTAGFEKKSYDETSYAKRVAEHLKVEHIIFNSELPNEDILLQLIGFFDEPFSDNSLVPTYWLNMHTKKHATVALSGDGADEVLAGYPTYKADRYYQFYKILPLPVQKAVYSFFKEILKPSYAKLSFDYKLLQFLGSYGLSREKAHYWWRIIFSETEKEKIMSPILMAACREYDPFETFNAYFSDVRRCGFLDQCLYVDQKTWLQDDILVKVDRMSMANSVEVRLPFLDHRLVEFLAKMPEKAKQHGNQQKVILKEAMKPYLPKEILHRTKRGFNAPVADIGATTIPSGEFSLFNNEYQLNSAREDITFKSFCFKIMGNWISMYSGHFFKEPVKL
jgi:asparagine synthase (glutamine-hydrolysing)